MFAQHTCTDACEGDGCDERSEPYRSERIAAAKKMCSACVVRPQCLEWALATDLGWGVAGGLSSRERKKLKSQRKKRKSA